MSIEGRGGMILAGKTPHSSTRAFWQSYQQKSKSKPVLLHAMEALGGEEV
jgi:hypothetical protein